MEKKELLIAPVCEAGLVLVVGLAAWALQSPLIFASLSPTAFEMVQMPHLKSARPYNVVAGHLLGVVAGFAALCLTHAWYGPAANSGHVTGARVWAAGIASLLTVLLTMLARAEQPAATATALVICLGTLQAPKDAAIIMAAVVLLAIIGEPVRRWRFRTTPKLQQS